MKNIDGCRVVASAAAGSLLRLRQRRQQVGTRGSPRCRLAGWRGPGARHTRPGGPASRPSSRHTSPRDHSSPAAAPTTSSPSGGGTHRAGPSSSSRASASSSPSHPPPRRRRPKGTCKHAWRGMEEARVRCSGARKEDSVGCPGAERRMQAEAAARVLNAVRTPCPPRAGGGEQQMPAKSGMLVGRQGAAQDGTGDTSGRGKTSIRTTKKL